MIHKPRTESHELYTNVVYIRKCKTKQNPNPATHLLSPLPKCPLADGMGGTVGASVGEVVGLTVGDTIGDTVELAVGNLVGTGEVRPLVTEGGPVVDGEDVTGEADFAIIAVGARVGSGIAEGSTDGVDVGTEVVWAALLGGDDGDAVGISFGEAVDDGVPKSS